MKKGTKVPKKLLVDLAARWQAGERYPALAKAAGEALGRDVTIGTFRFWLIKQLGGAAAYNKASAKRDADHPREMKGPPRREAVQLSDEKVPRIKSSRHKDGWRSKSIQVGHYRESVVISPEGVEYVLAGPNQKADLIQEADPRWNYCDIRLRLFKTSSSARTVAREERLVKRGEKAVKRKALVKRRARSAK